MRFSISLLTVRPRLIERRRDRNKISQPQMQVTSHERAAVTYAALFILVSLLYVECAAEHGSSPVNLDDSLAF